MGTAKALIYLHQKPSGPTYVERHMDVHTDTMTYGDEPMYAERPTHIRRDTYAETPPHMHTDVHEERHCCTQTH